MRLRRCAGQLDARSVGDGTHFVPAALVIEQRAPDLMRAGVAQRHQHVQIVDALDVELRQHRREVRLQQRQPPQLLFQQFTPGLHVAHAVEFVEPRAHFVARTPAGEKAVRRNQPVAARFRGFRGEDFDPLAAAQGVIQRYDPAVDFRAAAAMTHHRMHVIRKIQRGRAQRQIDHVALRRQRVNAVFDQFAVQGIAEALLGAAFVAAFAAAVQQLAHPFDLAVQPRVGRRGAAFLVAPVRGDAQFGLRVHVVGADLHLQRFALWSDHRGMQRSIVVALGARDVVVELAGNRRPQRMHRTQRGIAGRHILHQYPHRAQVVELADRHGFFLHLFPDAGDVLRAAGNLGLHALRLQRLAQIALDLLDIAHAIAAFFVKPARDLVVGLRFEMAKRQIFQLPLQLPDTQPVRQRRVDIAGQLRQRTALGLGALADGAHLRQLSRQQDRHHAQIAHHHQQQPAQALGVASAGCMPANGRRVQRPHLRRRALAFQQGRDRWQRLRQRWLDPRPPRRQVVEDGR